MKCTYFLLAAMAAVLLAGVSCGKRTPEAERPTAVAETPAARPSPSPATPTATATSISTPSPTAQPTVVPPTPGSTAPVVLKPNPDPPVATVLLTDIRIGVHPEEGGVDRIVFEFSGGIPEGVVEYVPDVAQCGSGMPVTLSGRAILLARFTGTDAHNESGQPTVPVTRLQGPGTTILETQQVCDFEAHVNWAIGVKDVQLFRVIQLSSPFRVVVDVKQ